MISVASLAQQYGVSTVDAEGYDKDPHALRNAVERRIRRYLASQIQLVTAWGPLESVPNIHRGELRAAHGAIAMAERDLSDVTRLRRTEAA